MARASSGVLLMDQTPDTRLKASQHWDTIKADQIPRRYWLFPTCVRAINRRIGSDSPLWMSALTDKLKSQLDGKRLDRGISIGCGAGGKELQLIKGGIVQSFELYEISQQRILQGNALFASAGFADKAEYKAEDGLAALELPERYDLVYWDSALHHMDDTRRSIELSVNALKPGGCLVINEYVGPNRFQWRDEEMHFMNEFRAALPDRFFSKSAGARIEVARKVVKPTVEQMIAVDPSEAPDSASILPALSDILPDATVWPLGGVIYHIALNDVIANFQLPSDEPLLKMAMLADEAVSAAGFNHFAACLYRKPLN